MFQTGSMSSSKQLYCDQLFKFETVLRDRSLLGDVSDWNYIVEADTFVTLYTVICNRSSFDKNVQDLALQCLYCMTL